MMNPNDPTPPAAIDAPAPRRRRQTTENLSGKWLDVATWASGNYSDLADAVHQLPEGETRRRLEAGLAELRELLSSWRDWRPAPPLELHQGGRPAELQTRIRFRRPGNRKGSK